jgi:hypothetical protein
MEDPKCIGFMKKKMMSKSSWCLLNVLRFLTADDPEPMDEEGVEVEAPAVLLRKTGRLKRPPKPLHTRAIVEVDQLSNFFQNFHCLQCGERPMELNIRTVCMATT